MRRRDPFRVIRRLQVPSSVGDWLWAAYLSAAVALFVVSATVAPALQTPFGLILSAGSVLAVAVGIYLHEPEPRGPWLLLAAGQLFFAIGDLAGRPSTMRLAPRHIRASPISST